MEVPFLLSSKYGESAQAQPRALLPMQPGSSSLCFFLMTHSRLYFSFLFTCIGCAGSSLPHGLSSDCGEQGLLFSWVCRLLIAGASPVAERGPAPAAAACRL